MLSVARAWLGRLDGLIAGSIGTVAIVPGLLVHPVPGGPAPPTALMPPGELRLDRSGPVRLLERRLDAQGYGLAAVTEAGRPVPRVFLAAFPDGFAEMDDAERRKDLFVRIVLPVVLAANEAVREERERLSRLAGALAAGRSLALAERRWVGRLAAAYDLAPDRPDNVPPELIERLLRRVDVVPPSLALAQAAVETGWGASRFASEGRALFGQWTWGGDGIVPAARPAGATYAVRRFASLGDSVAAYLRNLNTHAAYSGFRRAREALRRRGERPTGERLVSHLDRYAETGPAYVESLLAVIRASRLAPLDHSRLEPRPERGMLA